VYRLEQASQTCRQHLTNLKVVLGDSIISEFGRSDLSGCDGLYNVAPEWQAGSLWWRSREWSVACPLEGLVRRVAAQQRLN